MDTARAKRRGASILARGYAGAVIATVPAAASHGLADGHRVPWLALAVGVILAAAVCVPLVGRSISRTRIAAAVIASQGLFHLFFSGATALGTAAPSGAGADSAGHAAHGAAASAQLTAAFEGFRPSIHAGGTADAWMLVAHALAAVATISLAWYGLALVRGIQASADHFLRALVALVATVPALPEHARTAVATQVAAPLARLVAVAAAPRGPPALA